MFSLNFWKAGKSSVQLFKLCAKKRTIVSVCLRQYTYTKRIHVNNTFIRRNIGFLNTPLEQIVDDVQKQNNTDSKPTSSYLTTQLKNENTETLPVSLGETQSIDEFRDKLSKWRESPVLKMMDKDVGVLENERADILADKIHDMSSRRKRKMIYRELQKIIMLPSPSDPQQIKNCLYNIEKSLENVGSSLIPWLNAYFRGLQFPDSDLINMQDNKKEIDILKDVTTIFYSDWSETHYDGFQWRANVLRDCLDTYLNDDEHYMFYEMLNNFLNTKGNKKSNNKLFQDLSTKLSTNTYCKDIIALFEWVVKGQRDIPIISIAPITEPEIRSREAERHILLAAYHKIKYHTVTNTQISNVSAEKTQILCFRLATVLTDEQHQKFVHYYKRYQSLLAKDDKAVDRFINDISKLVGPLSYLILPSLKECVNDISLVQLSYIRKMKKPVMTVRAVRQYSLPGYDIPKMNQDSDILKEIDIENNADKYSIKTKMIESGILLSEKENETTKTSSSIKEIDSVDKLIKEDPKLILSNKDMKEINGDSIQDTPKRKRQILVFVPKNQKSLNEVTKDSSDFTIFVQNLPLGIYAEELAASFRPCGNVTKVEILDFTPSSITPITSKTIQRDSQIVNSSSQSSVNILSRDSQMVTVPSLPSEIPSVTTTSPLIDKSLEATVLDALQYPEDEDTDDFSTSTVSPIQDITDSNTDTITNKESTTTTSSSSTTSTINTDFKVVETDIQEEQPKKKSPHKKEIIEKKGKKINDEPEPETKIVGFVHFSDLASKMKALSLPMRLLGLCIRENMCRTEPAENKRTLYLGNIPTGLTGDEVAYSINKTLPPSYQICMQNVQQEGIVATSVGFCFIEFDSHQLASAMCEMLSNAEINGQKLKVCWALDNTDSEQKKRKRFWGYHH